MLKLMLAATAMIVSASMPASAAEVTVLPGDSNWRDLPAERRLGASATVTDSVARSGNGSLEIRGDRTRFATGSIYPNAATTPIVALNQVTGLTFDWRLAADSVTNPGYNPDYTPALRLHIWDAGAGVRREIIWEGAYNNTYGNTQRDTWYSTTLNDKFYVGAGNENAGVTIAQWAQSYAAGSFVGGISVGNGSGALTTYHAFADNVTLTTGAGSTTWNFNLTATAAPAVPEPASWAMMIAGFGLVGTAMRRRQPQIRYAV